MYKVDEHRHYKQILLELSDDKLKNEIMRLYGDRFRFLQSKGANTDTYIKKVRDNEYIMKVWNCNYRWADGEIFGEIAPCKNNTDHTVTFTKHGDQWRVMHIQRRYYGQSDINTQLQ